MVILVDFGFGFDRTCFPTLCQCRVDKPIFITNGNRVSRTFSLRGYFYCIFIIDSCNFYACTVYINEIVTLSGVDTIEDFYGSFTFRKMGGIGNTTPLASFTFTEALSIVIFSERYPLNPLLKV